jgi:hypothetical protein
MKKDPSFWRLLTLILVLSSLFSGAALSQTTVNLVSSADAYLSGANTTNNYGAQTYLRITLSTSQPRGSLLKWNVSSIPSNATVTSVSMKVNVSTAASQTYYLYNMRRAWVEGTGSGSVTGDGATWQTYDGTNTWGTNGAANTTTDRYNVNLWGAGTTTFSSTGSKTVSLNADGIAVVQGWISGTSTNNGLTIQNYATSSTAYDLQISSNNNTTAANRPTLIITYTVSSTDPTITTSGTLTAFSTPPGVASAAQTYTVAGTNLTTDININAPSGFQLSTDGSTYGSSLTLPQTSGTVATTTVYVRLYSTTESSFSGNITHTSTGATEVDKAVSGVVSNSGTMNLIASEDTYMSSVNTTYNYGSVDLFKVSSQSSTNRGALIKWDFSGIPSGATVTSANLTFYVSSSASQTYNLYNMRRSWVEGTLTTGATSTTSTNWTTYDGANTWGTAGAANTTSDRYNTNLWGAGTSSFSSTGSKTIDLNTDGIAVLQGWINGSIPNYGMTIQNYSGSTTANDLQISSSENATTANRPTLNITYSLSSEPTIIVTGTLNTFSSQPGVASAARTYTVAGSNLTADISITAPSCFELSTDGSTYSSNLTLAQTSGSVSTTNIYVRFFSATTGTFSGNITHISSGATSLNMAVSGTASTGWAAYNDCAFIDGQISSNITTYVGYTNNTTGLLKNYATGENTAVTVTVTTSGTVASQLASDQYGAETNSGTDGYSTFHGIANMVGGMRLGTSSSYIDLTFTGLNAANTYTFATTANRANSASDYITRRTKFTLSDVDAATNASTSGVKVTDNLNVVFSTGYNTVNGYVARWNSINPGSDGDFTIRFAVDSGTYAYGPAVFMLQEGSGETPVQYTLTVGNDGHGTVTLSPTGGVYNEGSTVSLTPVPNTGYAFSAWSGDNAPDPIDNGNGTWSLVMSGNKTLTANFIGSPTNVAPNQPVLVQPSDNATGISTSPTLQVTASDANASDVLSVSFYGRAAGASTGADFTFVVIPDPQNYATSYPAVYTGQTQWIVDNKTSSNIVFATAVGDLVNTSSSSTEYTRADAAFDILDAGNVPYSVSPGNHDMSMGTTLWPTYFGASRFTGKSWFKGSYDDYNSYSTFSASGNDFIVINLQYSPGTAILDWADALLKANTERQGIVIQHDILNIDNNWVNQASYTALKDNPNMFMMLCGHMHSASDGAAYVAGTGTDGHTIHIVQADYQDFAGSGYLRILRFSPSDDIIYMTTYSPNLTTSITTSPDQMNLTYDLINGSSVDYSLIGTAPGITNGTNASISWPGRSANTKYDWYTTVSDGSLTTNGSAWSFTTGSSVTYYTLTAGNDGHGNMTLNPSGGSYPSGTIVTLTTVPNSGYQFSSWSGTNVGDIINTGGVYTIVMNGNKSITANFTQIQYTLTAGNDGHGLVTVNPSGGTYATGTTVTLTPVPDAGYQFSLWTGTNAGDIINTSDIYTILMNGNKIVTADFTLIPVITVTSPNGGQNWLVGSSHNITWTSVNTSGTVHIEYSSDNGTNWDDVVASTSDDGTYTWTIPNEPSVNCLVRISDTDGNPTDISNVEFTITTALNSHFIPVWSNNGFDHMNFYTLSAKLDGIDLQPGDEIGVFDGTACVGVGILTQILNGSDLFLRIKASRDDEDTPEIEGYTAGNTASFRIWDASEEKEISSVEITYEAGYNNIFGANGSSWYHINGASYVQQDISLLNGWNIFSLFVTPDNIDMKEVVQPLIDAGNLVKVQNEAGDAIELNPFTNLWINDIGNWSNTEGYKIRVNASVTLSVTGTPITDPVNISLTSGWNIISYPISASYDAMVLLNSLITSGSLTKVQDESGDAIEHNPITNTWINDIGTFDPDEGYKMRVSAASILTIDPSLYAGGSSLKSTHQSTVTEHFQTAWTGNGLDHMNIYISETSGGTSGFIPGDEVGIYDGTMCVGSGVITNTGKAFHSFVVSADDPTTEEVDGFINGNTISFKVWRPANNKEVIVSDIVYATGSSKVFEPMGTAMVSINVDALGLNSGSEETTSLGDNYPNPFSGKTTIPFALGQDTNIDLAVFDILGNRVNTLMHATVSQGYHSVEWEATNNNGTNVIPGVYYIKLIAGDKVFVKTIVLVNY